MTPRRAALPLVVLAVALLAAFWPLHSSVPSADRLDLPEWQVAALDRDGVPPGFAWTFGCGSVVRPTGGRECRDRHATGRTVVGVLASVAVLIGGVAFVSRPDWTR